MSIAILYYSATGGTQLIAELLSESLFAKPEVRATYIGETTAEQAVREADFSVFCFPTYFLKPAWPMLEFVERLDLRDRPRRAYIVATYELYSENALRVLALLLAKRGMVVVGSKSIRAPGSDLTGVFPDWLIPWLYRFERRFVPKLNTLAEDIRTLSSTSKPKTAIPRQKWYTPATWLSQKLLLDRFIEWRHRIRVLPDRCNACGACIAGCYRQAWRFEGGLPRHLSELCDLCMRCVHHCPQKAIILVPALKDNRRLDADLYQQLGNLARSECSKKVKPPSC